MASSSTRPNLFSVLHQHTLYPTSRIQSRSHPQFSPTRRERLPLVLLGIRTAVKSDLGHSVSEQVYGTTLCVPSEFFPLTTLQLTLDPASYVDRLKRTLHDLQPPPSRPQHHDTHVPPDLQTCTHVFIRRDAVKKLLQPYDGPFKVLSRSQKSFKVDLGNHTDSVSLDRLKPAHLDTPPAATLPAHSTTSPGQETPVRHTRSGCRVYFPDRFVSIVHC